MKFNFEELVDRAAAELAEAVDQEILMDLMLEAKQPASKSKRKKK